MTKLPIVRLTVFCLALGALAAPSVRAQCSTYYSSQTITINSDGTANPDPACVTSTAGVTFTTTTGGFLVFFGSASPFSSGHRIHTSGFYSADTIDSNSAGSTYEYESCYFVGQGSANCTDPKVIVQPAGPLFVTPTLVDFGSQRIGSTTQREVAVVNHSKGPLTLTVGAGQTPFSAKNTCVTKLTPGSGCGITIEFQPVNAERVTRQIQVSYPGGQESITVVGSGHAQ
jgi:hypothetical protein